MSSRGTKVWSASSGCRLGGGATAGAHPAFHRHQQRAVGPRIIVRVRPLLSLALRGEIAARDMLRAGKQIDADIVRQHGILLAVERRMGEGRGAAAAPVFAGGVGVEDFRTRRFGQLGQQPIGLAGHRIALRQIEEREQRRLEESKAVGSGEARVEIVAPRRSGDMGDDAVERRPALRVGVEALVEKLAQEPPVLRGAECQGVAHRRQRDGLMLQRRRQIAQSRKPEACDRRVLRLVAQLVDVAGRKPVGEIQCGCVGHHRAVAQRGRTAIGRAGSRARLR